MASPLSYPNGSGCSLTTVRTLRLRKLRSMPCMKWPAILSGTHACFCTGAWRTMDKDPLQATAAADGPSFRKPLACSGGAHWAVRGHHMSPWLWQRGMEWTEAHSDIRSCPEVSSTVWKTSGQLQAAHNLGMMMRKHRFLGELPSLWKQPRPSDHGLLGAMSITLSGLILTSPLPGKG